MPGSEREPLAIIHHGRTREITLDPKLLLRSTLKNIVRLQIENVHGNHPRFIRIDSPQQTVVISHPELIQLHDIFARGDSRARQTRAEFFNRLDRALLEADRLIIGEILP